MTVPSASEDANSSDDVYSSVPDTSSENIETLDERVFHPQRGDALGPLPALPNSNPKEVNGNAKQLNPIPNSNNDQNNNDTRKGGKYNNRHGNKYNLITFPYIWIFLLYSIVSVFIYTLFFNNFCLRFRTIDRGT